MPGVNRALCVMVVVLGLAAAARTADAETVVLVDVPTRVEAAVRASLAPWGVDVVVVAPAPEEYAPGQVALAHHASFVVWRQGDELILYDAALATEERRAVAVDPDDAEAAAVALSIRTWMGLGATEGDPSCPGGVCPRPPPRRWLVEVSTGARFDPAGLGGADFRYGLAGGHRRGRLEAGLRVDLGMDREGVAFGQQGAWAVASFGAWGRVRLQAPRAIEVLPGVGVGFVHTAFTSQKAQQGQRDIDESTSAFALDAEVAARRTVGRLSFGARLGLTVIPTTQELKSRNESFSLDAHLEPWVLAAAAVAF